jgi:PAS domain-containing protein
MISPDYEGQEKLTREDDLIDNERTLPHLLNKLRHQYRNTIMTGEADRIGFEALLKDVESYFNLSETQANHTTEILRAEITILTKDRELKVKEWRDRYEKIQYRWDDLTAQLTQLQKEKEEIRVQRDQLLTTHKQKVKLSKEEKHANAATERRKMFERTLSELLVGITDSIEADRATVFLYSAPTEELKSIALYPIPRDETTTVSDYDGEETEDSAKIPKEIKIPATKGIAGAVFSSGCPENIENAYTDKRFFPIIDKQTGYRSKVMLTYPIYSVRSDSIIGVLQILNKKSGEGSFGLADEQRCTEFVSFLSYVFASVHELYDFLPVANIPSHHLTRQKTGLGFPDDISVNSDLPPDFGKSATLDFNGGIPKEMEDYIKKLEQCWRRAVGESANWQNRLSNMENENRKAKTKIFTLERKVTELEDINKEVKEKMLKHHKEYKIAKQEWAAKEADTLNELNACRVANQQLLVEQMKTGNEESVKSIILPVSNSNSPLNRVRASSTPAITLPYIDLKNQSKKIVINLSGESNGAVVQDTSQPSSPTTAASNLLTQSALPSPARTGLKSSAGNQQQNNNNSTQLESSTVNILQIDQSNHNSPQHVRLNTAPQCKDIYIEVFAKCPAATMLLSRNYRIWRVNNKFCDMLECDEQSLLGLTLSDISVGVELETLPRLLQFDIVQGLAICKPSEKALETGKRSSPPTRTGPDDLTASLTLSPNSRGGKKKKKNFTKVNIQIAQIGVSGEKYQVLKSTSSRQMKAPIYALVFTKAK